MVSIHTYLHQIMKDFSDDLILNASSRRSINPVTSAATKHSASGRVRLREYPGEEDMLDTVRDSPYNNWSLNSQNINSFVPCLYNNKYMSAYMFIT